MPEYFTLSELRDLPDMSNATAYPDATCEAAAARVVARIEAVCQTSFIARTVTDEVHDGGCYDIFLTKPWVLSVTSATENGTAVTDTLRVSKGGRLLRYSSATSYTPKAWLAGFDNVKVTYQAGYTSAVPADLKDAALQATRYRLLSRVSTASMNDRATSITNEFGNVNLSVAGKNTPFGLPEVDSVVIQYRDLTAPGLA